jgi:hypothetical protein
METSTRIIENYRLAVEDYMEEGFLRITLSGRSQWPI